VNQPAFTCAIIAEAAAGYTDVAVTVVAVFFRDIEHALLPVLENGV
jgi:hypothetical protein